MGDLGKQCICHVSSGKDLVPSHWVIGGKVKKVVIYKGVCSTWGIHRIVLCPRAGSSGIGPPLGQKGQGREQ